MHEHSICFENGRVLENQLMDSGILAKKFSHSVYLPPGYDRDDRRYPVLCLLPGLDQDDADWFRKGGVNRLVDQGVRSGEICPMIMVSPDGKRPEGKRQGTFYMNNADGRFSWEDMFLREFLPHVEKTYRTLPGIQAVGGLSMGGFGALRLALRRPGLFLAAFGISSTLFSGEQLAGHSVEDFNRRFSYAYGNRDAKGEARLNALYRENDPMTLLASLPAEDLAKTAMYVVCGGEDQVGLYEGNVLFHKQLLQRGIAHHFAICPGLHDWRYWRAELPGALRFVSEVFAQ